MDGASEYRCPVYSSSSIDAAKRAELLVRPVKSSADILALVSPILDAVRNDGDKGLRSCVVKFDRCVAAENDDFPLTLKAPFPAELAKIDPKVKEAIDVAYSNIKVRLRQSGALSERRLADLLTAPTCAGVPLGADGARVGADPRRDNAGRRVPALCPPHRQRRSLRVCPCPVPPPLARSQS